MKKFKKITVVGAVVLVIGAMSVTAFAASLSTPAEVLSGLTGKSVDSVIEERTDTGKTYGTLADEAGVLDAFKAETLDARKAVLDERVAAGTLTQEQADAILAEMAEHQLTCDGTGTAAHIGQAMGARFGGGMGGRHGAAAGQGMGVRQGGAGCGTGTCTGIGQAG